MDSPPARTTAARWSDGREPRCKIPPAFPPQVLQFRPVIWGPGKDQIEVLPSMLDDSVGAATAINDRSQVVGISGICDRAVGRFSAVHAVLWENGAVVHIGNLGRSEERRVGKEGRYGWSRTD